MNEHDATEIAFKNGYQKGAMDVFAEIEKVIDEKYNRFVFKDQLYDSDEEIDAIINYSDSVSDGIAQLKKKYAEGKE